MTDLFQHQVEGIKFLKETRRAILADEMGLGKTRQAILAAGEIQREDYNHTNGVLVVCPASLKINWEREIQMVYPGDDIHTIRSGPEEKLPRCPWTIINYDMLPKYKEQILRLIADGSISIAIIDEAHYIKGKKTIRATTTLDIVMCLEIVFALTGTPIMNRPIELFNLLKAIKHPLGRAITTFSRRYCGAYLKTIVKKDRILRFWDDKGATHLEELREFTKGSILRRLKKDVLDLPAKIVSVQITELSKESRKEYETAFDNYVEWLTNNPTHDKDIENIVDARHLVELMKLKQVCSRAKIDRIISDIRSAVDQGQKVIVFSQFTGTITALKEALSQEKRGSRYDDAKEPIWAVTLTGQDDMHARQEAVDAFQNKDDAKVFIANIKAGGVGITLTAASIVMFADMEWSPELHSQAEDRAHRIGQTGTVNVYYYIAGETIEEDIVDILERKRTIIKELMDGDKTGKWAAETERIIHIQDEEERTLAMDALQKDMSASRQGGTISMAAEFLDRMKTRLGIHT